MGKDSFPLITIGVPVKDEEHCIRYLLKSLENLDYPKERIKIVFVEGFSADGTYDILAEWVERARSRYYDVVLMRAKSNIPQARNICIRNMAGDYIFFWNADTLAPADSIKVTLEILSQSKALAAICISYTLVDPRDMKAWGWMPRDDFVAFKKRAFDIIGYFNELFYVGEYEILRRIEENVKTGSWLCPSPAYTLRRNDHSETRLEDTLLS